MYEPPLKPLSPLEWESLIDDYSNGGDARLHRWISTNYSSTPLLDLCVSSLLRKDFPLQLKLNLLIFLEQHLVSFFSAHPFSRLLESLRSVIQSPTDPFYLKDQFLISSTSIFIASCLDDDLIKSPICELVELLLTIINRPNHGLDRQTRGIACECLRQLELAFPCLLSEITTHLWALCQSERTHVAQSYVLLLSTTLLNVVKLKPGVVNIVSSINNASIPLVPFNLPLFLIDGHGADFVWKEKEVSYRELRRVIAFLLEWPPNLTPFGLMEFLVAILPVAQELELQASLLRVQFSGLLCTYEPLLYHCFLGMYLKFLSSFQVQEVDVAHRLIFLSNDSQQYLVYRLLALHWLLGFFSLISSKDSLRTKNVLDMNLRFYPTIFDPLAVKALKLDLLAYSSFTLCYPRDSNGAAAMESGTERYDVKLFKDCLVSVSAFKWLPPWSTETAVAFHTLYKFLVGASPHVGSGSLSMSPIVESSIFLALQNFLVESTLEFKGLVPVTVLCIDRLLGCHEHRLLGEYLLNVLDNKLLPKLKVDFSLGSYFPIFEGISKNEKGSPSGTLELFMKFMLFLVEKQGPDSGLKSWYHGSKVLGICRTMLVHHHSSSLFTGLSRLLSFMCLFFPDLEVRENARFYLRMLICVPGKKLRHLLKKGESFPAIAPAHPISFFSHQSPQTLRDLKRSENIASYIHVERVIPLLVKQSWALSLPALSICPGKPGYLEGIQDNEPANEEKEISSGAGIISESEIHQQKEPLRVMDSKISEIVSTLRRHFSCIPDYRYMPGLKVMIPCTLKFDAEPFCTAWEINKDVDFSDGVNNLPALYATVLKFTTSAPYGSISSFHHAFLLGSSVKTSSLLSKTEPLAIVSMENLPGKTFKAPVRIELELREPVPGLVDVFIETNAGNGQIIQGQLKSIYVGIEDMFLRAILPDDIKGDDVPNYYMNLFTALWEACETSSNTGRESFVLKGGKGVAVINGTRSVKLVEISATSLISAVECHLARFVVCVIGEQLVNMVKAGGVIKNAVWKEFSSDSPVDAWILNKGPLFLKYAGENEREDPIPFAASRKTVIGFIHVLIFLPPRFHLLFQMEVQNASTLVRIRTDHWPCLAYVDDYLEAIFVDLEV